ncbi:MAG: hypothetical protein BMS9Abin28_1030 [Anaerolineae bacterium]|nr:MAG: hypothetical protein BMS9Abin28_1030 [Anaerolineae bacterium]
MKKIIMLAGFMLAANLFVLALTLGDFLALHGMQHELVSEDILGSLGIRLS